MYSRLDTIPALDWRTELVYQYRAMHDGTRQKSGFYTRATDNNINKNLCGRDGRTICGPQCVPKSTSVTLAVDEKTLSMATITGRTDRQIETRVRRNMRPPPREEGRIITKLLVRAALIWLSTTCRQSPNQQSPPGYGYVYCLHPQLKHCSLWRESNLRNYHRIYKTFVLLFIVGLIQLLCYDAQPYRRRLGSVDINWCRWCVNFDRLRFRQPACWFRLDTSQVLCSVVCPFMHISVV